jgi:hypothetical protein
MISIRVDGTLGEYDNLTDGIMSVFHHELFHNLQRNISLHYGNKTIAGREEAWMMFSEGTAVLASSVGQPTVQFEATPQARSYLKRANAFIGSEGATGGGLNKSYRDMPYHTAIYWRFLYESCGGIYHGAEYPAAGMQVIRHVLEALYKGEMVQIDSSSDLAYFFPRIVDQALRSTPSCAFHSYEESLVHFARAIYMLRLEDGRCPNSLGAPSCGFLDPNQLYETPPAEAYVLAEGTATDIAGSIPSSYGIDLDELALNPALEGKTLKLAFRSADPELEYHVELLRTKTTGADHEFTKLSVQTDKPVSLQTENGRLTIELADLGNADYNGLGLIITRLDPYEATEDTGTYTIQIVAD